MKKAFRLPRKFGEEWLVALRSGEYIQGEGYLTKEDKDGEGELTGNFCFCCIGVAATICGYDAERRLNIEFVRSAKNDFPIELLEQRISAKETETNPLPNILASFNDGMGFSVYYEYLSKHHLFISKRVDKNHKQIKYSFLEIATFIEENVDFY